MDETLPKISFVTPNYNDGKYIKRMVESIMDQDYPALEQIIVDDGSTDDSKKILKKLEKKYGPKLKVFYLIHQGACVARNYGASHATGKYLSFLPADAYLYAGMARTWVNDLEDNPQFDFLYGGYKFTDENYHELYSYIGDSFDPYFLTVSNYIDGSFPLKRELFDKMGGWDPEIKSLQDWDFWLNAVLKHNAKGLYRGEVYFETTMPHPGGLSDDSHRNWIDRTSVIKAKYGIQQRDICVTGPGAPFHAKNIAKWLNADYLPLVSFKPHKYKMIYVVGFFGSVSQQFWNTNCMRVVHWIGSDIYQLQNADPKVLADTVNWIDNNVDVNFCEMEQTRKELDALGIKARILPLPPQKIYEPMPLPEKFAVAVYSPYQNKGFYHPDLMIELVKEMRDVDFYFFGDPGLSGGKDNLHYAGVVSGAEKDKLVADTSCILRATIHDGLPLSVVEWITAGRNAIATIDIPYTEKVEATKESIVAAINKVRTMPMNAEGSKHYSEICSVKNFTDTINSLLKFDMKKWWDKMAPLWPQMEHGQIETEDIIFARREMAELKPKSLIEVGCGTGRWKDLLDVEKYVGLDFSADLVKVAEERHPKDTFVNDDLLHYASSFIYKKYDVAFTFACFLHVTPEEFEKNCNALKHIAHKAILIEPIMEMQNQGRDRGVHPEIIKLQKEDPTWLFNVKYTFIHDYFKHFKVEKVVQMSNNRNLFVIDLDNEEVSDGHREQAPAGEVG